MAKRARSEPRSSREAFVAATAKLLRRQGYNATGLNQVVALSGAPKGSLYFHFPGGKEELAVASMTDAGEKLRRSIAAVVDSSDSVEDSLARLVDALAAGLESSGFEEGCPIATVTLEAATSSDSVRATAAAVFDSWLGVLEQRFAAAGLAPAVAERRALLVLSAIEGGLILSRARGDVSPLTAVRHELLAMASD